MMKSLKFLVYAALTTVTESKVVINTPEVLKDKFKDTNGEIQAVYANFGYIPYG